jgi:hypothetical protein
MDEEFNYKKLLKDNNHIFVEGLFKTYVQFLKQLCAFVVECDLSVVIKL